MIAADRRLVSVWPTAPGDRRRGDDCATIGFVFKSLQHHSCHIELSLIFRTNLRKRFRISMPAPCILRACSLKTLYDRRLASTFSFVGIPAKAKHERESSCGMYGKKRR